MERLWREKKATWNMGNLAPAKSLLSSIFCESIAKLLLVMLLKTPEMGFPCYSEVKNLAANAGDTSLIPAGGRSHMSWGN